MVGQYALRGTCSAIALCLLGGLAQAQTSDSQGTGQAPAAESGAEAPLGGRMLDTISVTATRNPVKSFEYPGMVTVIGREEIQTRQPSTVDDVLRFVPNVEFTGGPRRTGEVPSIRGFSGADVIVLLDGARQNFGSAHDGRFFVDPSLLKQVEVLRGPASALYGSGGTGGVIEFRTVGAGDLLQPGKTAGASLAAGFQTVNEERTATLTGFGKPTAGSDLIGSVTSRESGTITLGDGSKLTNTSDDIISGLLKGGVDVNDFNRLEASLIGFNNDAKEPNNGQGSGGSDIVDKKIRTHTLQGTYSYKNPSNNVVDLDMVAYYTDFGVDETRLDGNGNGPQGELLKRDVNTVGLRLDNRSRVSLTGSTATTLTYGGEFYRDEQNGAAGSGERDGVPDAKTDFFGVFGQAEVAVNQAFGVIPGDFLIIPGLRYDDYSTTSPLATSNNDSETSPRLGVSYLPTEWLLLFANYAHAFRAPTFDETFLTGTHFQINVGSGVVNSFVPNPALKPQRTRTFEFGGGLTFDALFDASDFLQVKASYFQTKGKDFIDTAVDQPTVFVDCNPNIPGACDGTTTSTNVPNAKLWGAEVEGSYESNRLLLVLGYSQIDGKNEDTGAKLGVLTPDQLTLNTGVKLPEIDSLIGWRMLAADDFENVNNSDDRRAGYVVHDFYFAWAPTRGSLRGLRIDLGVDNAFDKAYSRVFTGALEAGRNWKARAGYTLQW